MGKSVGRKSPEVSRHVLKVSPANNKHFKAHDRGAEQCSYMRTNKKSTKNRKLRGLKLRGFRWNHRSTLNFLYKNDWLIINKINTLSDFWSQTPTHMGATHAISKIHRKFQNRILRELDQNCDIPRISLINWISSNVLRRKKNAQTKKWFRF